MHYNACTFKSLNYHKSQIKPGKATADPYCCALTAYGNIGRSQVIYFVDEQRLHCFSGFSALLISLFLLEILSLIKDKIVARKEDLKGGTQGGNSAWICLIGCRQVKCKQKDSCQLDKK